MTVDAALSQLEVAFTRRLTGDGQFVSLTELVYGWPKTLLAKPTAAGLPITTWFTPDRVRLSSEPGHLEIQTDDWVWPSGASGGRSRLDAIDNCKLRLLGSDSAVTWYDAVLGIHVSSVCLDAGDPPEEKLLRRRRLWQVAAA
jgi:hypothetical protein